LLRHFLLTILARSSTASGGHSIFHDNMGGNIDAVAMILVDDMEIVEVSISQAELDTWGDPARFSTPDKRTAKKVVSTLCMEGPALVAHFRRRSLNCRNTLPPVTYTDLGRVSEGRRRMFHGCD
jgi:hypothetical protein